MIDFNLLKLQDTQKLSVKIDKKLTGAEIFSNSQNLHKQQYCVKTENFYDECNSSSEENNSMSTAFSPLISENQSDLRMDTSQKIEKILRNDEDVVIQECGKTEEEAKIFRQKNIGDFVYDILNCKDKKRGNFSKSQFKSIRIPLQPTLKKTTKKDQQKNQLNNENNQMQIQQSLQNQESEQQQQQQQFVYNNEQLSVNNKLVKKSIKKFTTGFSFKKGGKSDNLKLKHWTPEEEKLFFLLVGKFGLDFNLLEHYIQNKNRKQIMMKYNREDKQNPQKIDLALKNQLFDQQEQLDLESICRVQEEKILVQEQNQTFQQQQDFKQQLDQQQYILQQQILQ